MDYYTFVVTEYHIAVTRAAFDTDDLYLSHSVHVDGTLVASDFAYLGSFDEGTTRQTGSVGIPAVVINCAEG